VDGFADEQGVGEAVGGRLAGDVDLGGGPVVEAGAFGAVAGGAALEGPGAQGRWIRSGRMGRPRASDSGRFFGISNTYGRERRWQAARRPGSRP
jgi:hypothetical protein